MAKNGLKYIGYFLTFVLILIIGFTFINYAPDKSLEELKNKWAYPDSKFIDIDGMPVHYRITGEGHPLVLIHGTGASLHTWEQWTDLLKADFKIISLDLPAYGLTGPHQSGNYSLPFYSNFLNEFLVKMKIDSFHLAGNSLGGAIAWRYTIDHPEKVRKLVLIDAAGYPSNKETPMAFKLAGHKLMSKIMLKVTPKSLYKKSLLDVYEKDDLVTPEKVERYYELSLRPGNRQAFIDRLTKRHIVDMTKITEIKSPTLILWGEKDNWISVANANRFQEDIPNSRKIIYKDAGHVPMEEIPEKTASDSKKFLLN